MNNNLSILIAILLLSIVVAVPAYSNQIEHSAGPGIGLPYGGVGGNYELS